MRILLKKTSSNSCLEDAITDNIVLTSLLESKAISKKNQTVLKRLLCASIPKRPRLQMMEQIIVEY